MSEEICEKGRRLGPMVTKEVPLPGNGYTKGDYDEGKDRDAGQGESAEAAELEDN